MKNKILLGTMLVAACTFSIQVKAQLKVLSTGNVTTSKHVAINGASISDSISLNVNLPNSPSGSRRYGIFSSFEAPYNAYLGGECRVGIVGQVFEPSLPHPRSGLDPHFPILYMFSAGVAGVAYTGIGVYGATASSLPTSWKGGTYAGYFDGNVKATGTITATTITSTSDARLKENVSEIDKAFTIDVLSRLTPVSYNFRKDSSIFDSFAEKSVTHYGLIAQELQQILPELVYEDGAGYLSINYTEFIPILLNAVRTLSAEVEALKTTEAKHSPQRTDWNNAALYQNNPNPFTADTKITYYLPESTQNATLYIYNMNGLQVAEYPISSTGEGSVIISAGALEAGMYLYSLIADGQVIDTKRMILTK